MEKPGKKYCKAIVNLAVALVILLLFVWLVPKVLVLLMPFVIGWIIALIAGLERFRRLKPHDLENVEELLEKERDRKK